MSPKQKAARLAPDYFKADRKQTRRFWGSLAIAIVAIVAATYAAVGTRELQKTPCNANPSGSECANLRLEVAEAEPLRNPCASYQRVTSRRGRNCKRFYVPEASSTTGMNSSGVETDGATDSPAQVNTPSVGNQTEGAEAPAGGNHGSQAPHHPGSPSAPGPQAPAQPTPASPLPVPLVVKQPASRGEAKRESALESAGSTAGEVVNDAGEALEATTCGLTGPLLCPQR